MKKKQVRHKVRQRSASELFDLVHSQLRLPRVSSLHDHLAAETALRAEFFEQLANLLLQHFPSRERQKLGGKITGLRKQEAHLVRFLQVMEAEVALLKSGRTRGLNKAHKKLTQDQVKGIKRRGFKILQKFRVAS